MTATLTPQGTDTQTTKKKRKPLMITLISLIVIAPFVLNAIIINGFTPTSVRGGDPTSFYAQYGGISVYQATNLTSGGIGSLSIKSDGYVNLLKEGRDIYINKDITDKSISVRTSFLYRHEIAHVDQKELVANKAGDIQHGQNLFSLSNTSTTSTSLTPTTRRSCQELLKGTKVSSPSPALKPPLTVELCQ